MLALLYIFVIPYMVGMSLGCRNLLSETYTKGFVLHVSLFSACYAVEMYILKNQNLAQLAWIYRIIVAPFVVTGIIRLLKRRKEYAVFLHRVIDGVKVNQLIFLLAFTIILFQILRVGLCQTFVTSDNKTYDALIHDMVSSGTIYGSEPVYGGVAESIDKKMFLTSWYVYEAYISMTTKTHSMIVTNTVLPVFLVFVSYLVLCYIARFIFRDNRKQMLFLLVCALIAEMQTVLVDEAAYRLIWPTWGKSVAACIACPLMALFFMQMVKETKTKNKSMIWMILVSYFGVFCSAASLTSIPLMVGCLAFVFTIRERKLCYIFPSFLAIIPEVQQFVIMILYNRGYI